MKVMFGSLKTKLLTFWLIYLYVIYTMTSLIFAAFSSPIGRKQENVSTAILSASRNYQVHGMCIRFASTFLSPENERISPLKWNRTNPCQLTPCKTCFARYPIVDLFPGINKQTTSWFPLLDMWQDSFTLTPPKDHCSLVGNGISRICTHCQRSVWFLASVRIQLSSANIWFIIRLGNKSLGCPGIWWSLVT